MTTGAAHGAMPSGSPPFLGSARGGLRFELAVDPDAADEPFVVLDDSGRFSRVLLARVAAAGGATLLPVALKVQRDAYLPGTGAAQVAWTNEAVDEAWARERDALRAIDSPHVVRLLPVPDRSESPPMWYCRAIGEYFEPCSPQTGEPLRTCRDDTELREAGLGAYSTTLQRYLRGGTEDGKVVYYKRGAVDDEPRDGGIALRGAGELVRDFAVLARGERRAKRPFPCASCAQRTTCYPEPLPAQPVPAEQRLVPVSFHDFGFLPLPAAELTYDELCDLLGGAAWTEVRERASGPGQRGRAGLFPALDALYARPTQWLFRHDARERFAVEVLRLKLTAFAQACAGVAALHAATGRPHLGVQPGNLVVKVAAAGDGVPARWLGEVQLIDLGSARRYLPPDASARDVPLRLVPDEPGLYRSPLTEERDAAAPAMGVEVTRCEAAGEGVEIVLRLRPPSGFAAAGMRPDDVVRVTPTGAVGGRRDTWVWTQLVAVERDGLTVLGTVPAAHPLAQLRPKQSFDARVMVLPSFGPACDLYSLGMLLFRTLLVHDAQDMAAVHAVVRRCIDRLELDVAGRNDPARFCREHLLRALREHDAVFRPAALLWRRDDRVDALAGFPRLLWQEVLLFAFRLATAVPGFSFADSHANTHPQNPGALAQQVLAEVRAFLARAHVELFASAARDRELAEVCGELLAELRGELVSGALAAARGGVTAPDAGRQGRPAP